MRKKKKQSKKKTHAVGRTVVLKRPRIPKQEQTLTGISGSSELHSDLKSHNVTINVLSGLSPEHTLRELKNWQNILNLLRSELKNAKAEHKPQIKADIKLALQHVKLKKRILDKEIKKIK